MIMRCRERLRLTLVFGALLSTADQGNAQPKDAIQMSDTITVRMQSAGPHLYGGPVPVTTVVQNAGPDAASVLLPYPNPNNLSFRCASRDWAQTKPVQEDPIERTAPLVVPPGGTVTRTYFLNRYLRFLRPGTAECSYSLRMLVTRKGAQQSANHETFAGTFTVQLDPASDDQLRAEMARYAARLDNPDRQTKAEAAEALAFLDTPLVVPFLMRMLRIDNLEAIGIHALGRHPSEESFRAIAAMLGHPDSAVVSAALEEIDRHQIQIPRRDIQKLLASENPAIVWAALGWLANHPSREDLPLLAPMLNSPNVPLRERAHAYRQLLAGQ
jgi:hypothetical protein